MGAGGVNRSASSAGMDLADVAVVLRSLSAGTSSILLRMANRHRMSQIWVADVGGGRGEGGEVRE